MPQFEQVDFFLSQLFWLAVIFTGLYFVMARVALPRVAEVLEERSERLAEDLERAEKLRQEAEEVVAGYEAALSKARSEAAGVLSETGKEIQALTAKREAEFAKELARKTAAAEARIAAAKAEAEEQARLAAAAKAAAEEQARLAALAKAEAEEQARREAAAKLAAEEEAKRQAAAAMAAEEEARREALAKAEAQVRDIALEATIDITARRVGSPAEQAAVSDTVDDVLKEAAT